ncbi:helix-turn-helix domain-containing protein [Levilactobacillus brevis]|uniref:helix-turn-helix domain-containing protein n=1 Tax=Levilactobacillus brevis TaxID=1580 RepID=UPI00226F9F07|nr:helix-turn-helix domain-containing protein [Levilactobacillus brevis]
MVKTVVLKRTVDSDVYTIPQAAKKLKISPNKVRALIGLGKLNCLQLGQLSIPKFEVDRFMHDNLSVDLRPAIDEWIEENRNRKSVTV